jgi:dTDP-4-dehydrorhamnose reductase
MRTLIIGSGFVGSALAERILSKGGDATLASRHPSIFNVTLPWTSLDITESDDCARVIEHSDYDAIVLVHGPSDVTWCQQHREEARWRHEKAARNVADVAKGRRIVLISTDNVFDGSLVSPVESTPVCPVNAYGIAKICAERAIERCPNASVLRVSLIYGWEPAESSKWLNFFAACAHRLRSGKHVVVPFDQWTTPVLLEDVITVTTALLDASSIPPLLHLGGPERISRAAWASIIAERLDVAPELVVAEPKANGRYAARPANSCLSSLLLTNHPSTETVHVRGPREGATMLIDQLKQHKVTQL